MLVAAGVKVLEPAAVVGQSAVVGEFLDVSGGFVLKLLELNASCHRALDELARLQVTRLTAPDLDGNYHHHLVRSATPPAFLLPADEGHVHFHGPLRPDGVQLGTDQGSAQRVQELKGGFVARDAQLLLQFQRQDAKRLPRNQMGRPEPGLQRGLGAVKDGASGHRRLTFADSTLDHARACRNQEWLPNGRTAFTAATAGPARRVQVAQANGLVGKYSLEPSSFIGNCVAD